MINQTMRCGVLFSFLLSLSSTLEAGEAKGSGKNLSLATSAELFPLVEYWGEAASPGHFVFQVYGCFRPNWDKAHAECDTAIGVVKGSEADTFFWAIDEALQAEDKGNITIVPPALISCERNVKEEAEEAPRCTIVRDHPFDAVLNGPYSRIEV